MNPNDTRWKTAAVDPKLAVHKAVQLVKDAISKLDQAKEMAEDAGQSLFIANNTINEALRGLRGQEDNPAFDTLQDLAERIDPQVSYYSRNKPAEHLSRMQNELLGDVTLVIHRYKLFQK